MNCEHGVDIDEYDCSDCKSDIEAFNKKFAKENLIKFKEMIEKTNLDDYFAVRQTMCYISEISRIS